MIRYKLMTSIPRHLKNIHFFVEWVNMQIVHICSGYLLFSFKLDKLWENQIFSVIELAMFCYLMTTIKFHPDERRCCIRAFWTLTAASKKRWRNTATSTRPLFMNNPSINCYSVVYWTQRPCAKLNYQTHFYFDFFFKISNVHRSWTAILKHGHTRKEEAAALEPPDREGLDCVAVGL